MIAESKVSGLRSSASEADSVLLFGRFELAFRYYARLISPDCYGVGGSLLDVSVPMWVNRAKLWVEKGFQPWGRVVLRSLESSKTIESETNVHHSESE